MLHVPTAIRRADPNRGRAVPDLDDRAEAELAALLGQPVRPVPAPAPVPARSSRRRAWLVMAVVAALVVLGSVAALGIVRACPAPASPNEAVAVHFDDPALAAEHERAVERFATRSDVPLAALGRVVDAVRDSPQLRVDARHDGSASGSYQTVGPHRFDLDSTGDDPPPLGGHGTGADTIDVYAMHCSGDGEYRWQVLGHRVGSTRTRTRLIAHAEGTCGDGLTAARFITRGDVITTTLQVAVPAGTAFGIADLIYSNFGSPILDSPYPTD